MQGSIAPSDVTRWLAATSVRRSRREFDGTPVEAADVHALEESALSAPRWGDARCVVVADAPAGLFRGIAGAYGRVSGAPSALLFVADMVSAYAVEHCGHLGEAIVLEATARGLDTCWVGGFFSGRTAHDLAGLTGAERVLAVSPLGHAVAEPPMRERVVFGAGKPKRRRSLEEIAPGVDSWPDWARVAVETARLAPSAMNRQPWRFSLEDDALVVAAAGAQTPGVSLRLDCGIAMLHAEIGALSQGSRGSWRSLDPPRVAAWQTQS